MGRIYNILFNSTQGTGTIGSRKYFFDWSQLPDGQYRCTFSFVTTSGTTSVACANIFMDLGQGNVFVAGSVTNGQLSSNTFYIGNAGATAIGANSYVYAETFTNPAFYLSNKPSSNEVTIRVLQNDANQSAYTPELRYSLNLSLELLD